MAGEHYLNDADTAKQAPNYLGKEIQKRVKHGPIKFKLVLQIADARDKLNGPWVTWPKQRKTVELGTIEITKTVVDNDAAQKQLIFLSTRVPLMPRLKFDLVAGRNDQELRVPLDTTHQAMAEAFDVPARIAINQSPSTGRRR